MKREVLTLALRVAVPLTLLAVAPTQASTQISKFGAVITAPGTYAVTQDLTGSGNAITVLADNVDLHLGGHTLSGDGFSGAGVDVEGAANVSIHHGTAQGFHDGIFLNRAVSCKVSSVTASRNGHDGIDLQSATGNTVTDNTTNQNGSGGIDIATSAGNTVTRNTADRNDAGIQCRDFSYGNTVSHNTVTKNGSVNIRLHNGPNQNTVQDNTCSGSYAGIQLVNFGAGGAVRNTIQSNTTNLNIFGILVGQDCTGNTFQGNTALTNFNIDLEDDNPGCDSNVWTGNTFVTDLVAGASDGGPGVGCIQ
jgi:parallel beta-helix repeat protein